MIIETVDIDGGPLALVAEHISSVYYGKNRFGCWVVHTSDGVFYRVTEVVAQGVIKNLRAIHSVREVLP